MTMTNEPLGAVRAGISETRFRAMGSSVHVLVVGGRPRLVTDAEQRVAQLERSWSRFMPGSELNGLNASAGTTVSVSEDLYAAVSHALDAWFATGGAYDPTVLRAIEASGYDRSFELVTDDGDAPASVSVPGCDGIELDATERTITLPRGVAMDLGGIGKGLAADLVVTELFRLGAEGALVNVGGDVRVAGMAPGSDGWIVEIEDPFRPQQRGVCVALADGAVVTSSRLEKRWSRGGREMHHLIDPASGSPIDTDLVAVTVVAADAWWAEALTKAVFVRGIDDGRALVETSGAHGLLFLEGGSSVVAGDWRDVLA